MTISKTTRVSCDRPGCPAALAVGAADDLRRPNAKTRLAQAGWWTVEVSRHGRYRGTLHFCPDHQPFEPPGDGGTREPERSPLPTGPGYADTGP